MRPLLPYAVLAIVVAAIAWGLTRSGLIVGLSAGITTALLRIERATSPPEEPRGDEGAASYRELKERLAREMGLGLNDVRVVTRARAIRQEARSGAATSGAELGAGSWDRGRSGSDET